jgi:Subtilase family
MPIHFALAICVRQRAISVGRSLIAFAIATVTLIGAATEGERDAEAPAADAQVLVMIRMEPAHFRPDVDYGHGYSGRAGLAARQRAARAIARTHGLQLLSQWPMPAIGVECYVMQVPQGVSAMAALAALERDDRAAWAQPMQTFDSRGYTDPLYDLQPSASAWQLHQLHEVASGRGVLIAQIDSGVEVNHPDLRGQFHSVQNTADDRYAAEQHGTAVAGVIAARAGNGVGIVGVAPAAQLLVLRGCHERIAGKAICTSLALAKALQLALDRRARVVNLSVSGPRDRLLGALLDAALERGVIVVAAADADARDGGFPASHAGVIGVTDARTATSPGLLAAVGTDVPTTLPGERWGMVSGSSFAAAAVSGVAERAILR